MKLPSGAEVSRILRTQGPMQELVQDGLAELNKPENSELLGLIRLMQAGQMIDGMGAAAICLCIGVMLQVEQSNG